MKNILVVFLSVLLFSPSCRSKKEMSVESENNYREGNLPIKEAYFQEEVPGIKEEKKRQYITINLSEANLSVLYFDSIQVISNNYIVKNPNQVMLQGRQIKKELLRSKKEVFIDDGNHAQISEVILYFKKGNFLYRQVVSPIQIKEPIYLP